MEPIKLIVQLDKVTTTRDGGTKITFECGAESLDAVLEIQKQNAEGEVNFGMALLKLGDKDETL